MVYVWKRKLRGQELSNLRGGLTLTSESVEDEEEENEVHSAADCDNSDVCLAIFAAVFCVITFWS